MLETDPLLDQKIDQKTAVSEMQTLMLEIGRALVDDSDEVRVDVLSTPESTALRLFVSPNDIGKVIGKQGRTARSLRTILSAASMKLHHRFSLDIVETGKTVATREEYPREE